MLTNNIVSFEQLGPDCANTQTGLSLSLAHISHSRFSHVVAASVAQLNARPTGDQEVAGSTPAEVGNILSWRLIVKYFLRSFSPFR